MESNTDKTKDNISKNKIDYSFPKFKDKINFTPEFKDELKKIYDGKDWYIVIRPNLLILNSIYKGITLYKDGRVEILVKYENYKELRNKIFEVLNDYYKALPLIGILERNLKIQSIYYQYSAYNLQKVFAVFEESSVTSSVSIDIEERIVSLFFSKPTILNEYNVNFLIKTFFILGKKCPVIEFSIIIKTINPPNLEIRGNKYFKDWVLKNRTIGNFLLRKVCPYKINSRKF